MTRRTPKPKAVDPVWREFIQWCASRRLRSLPAHSWAIAAFLRWREESVGKQDAEDAVKAIAKAHRQAGKRSAHRDPVVERTVELIRNKRDAKNAGSDLFDADSMLFGSAMPPADAIVDEGDETDGDTPATGGRKLSSTPKLVSRRPTR